MRNKLTLLYMFITFTILTGCWDNVEIDERAFITGIGFDKYQGGKRSVGKESVVSQDRNLDKYIMTITYPNVAVIARKEEGDPSYTYSTICASPSDGKQQVLLRNNKNFFLNQAKTIILGQDLAKDSKIMREIMDVIERSVYIPRKVHLYITKGTAKDILEADSGKNMDTGLYIEELTEKEMKSSRRPKTSFDSIVINLKENNAAIAPLISKSETEIYTGGSAIFKNYKVVGWLDELETRAVNILMNNIQVADFTIIFKDLYVVVEQTTSKAKMKVSQNDDGRIVINFRIRIEGNVLQHYFNTPQIPFESSYIQEINDKVQIRIENELKDTITKLQKEFNADVIGAREYLRKYEPDIWDKVKDDWEELYPEAKVNIDIELQIRRVGIKS